MGANDMTVGLMDAGATIVSTLNFAKTTPNAVFTLTNGAVNNTITLAPTKATFSKYIEITDGSSATSTTTGALRVTGGAGISENLWVGGTSNIAGATTLQSSLTVTGATTLNGAATIGNGDDNVAINAGTGTFSLVSSHLNITTAGVISDAVGDVEVNDNLAVSGTLGVTGATTLSSTLAVTGATNLNGNVTLGDGGADVITVNSTSGLVINTGANPDMTITESAITRNGNIAINPGAGNNVTTDGGLTVAENATIAGTLGVTGATSLSSTLTVTGATTLNGAATIGNGDDNVAINAGSGSFSLASSQLNVTTAGVISDAGGDVEVNDNLAVTGTLGVTGATSLSSTLTVTGATTLNGAATIGNGDDNVAINAGTGSFSLVSSQLNITTAGVISDAVGDVEVNDNLAVSGTLGVTGATTLSSTLAVTGATNLNGNVTLGDGGADVITVNSTSGLVINTGANPDMTITESAITRNGNIAVNPGAGNNVTTDGGLTVAENATITGTLGVTGATTLASTLAVTGATTLNGAATIGNGDDNVAINAGSGSFSLVSSQLNVTTAGVISDAGGDVEVNDNLAVTGTLGVTGATTLNGAATIGNGDDNVAINAGSGTFSVVSSHLNVTTAGVISDAVGDVEVNDNLSVTGTATVKSGNALRIEDNDGATHYTSFVAGAQAANLEYTLPTTAPTSTNRVLAATTYTNPMTLAWSNPNDEVVYGVNSPAQWGTQTDNFAIPASSTVLRVSSSANVDLTGLSNTNIPMGRIIVLVNVGSSNITLKNNSGSSSAGNKFKLPGGTDITLAPDGSVTLMYDTTSSVWRVLSVN